jgi:hypothetical protein
MIPYERRKRMLDRLEKQEIVNLDDFSSVPCLLLISLYYILSNTITPFHLGIVSMGFHET